MATISSFSSRNEYAEHVAIFTAALAVRADDALQLLGARSLRLSGHRQSG